MDSTVQHLRDSVILTTSYVETNVMGDWRSSTDNTKNLKLYNQVNLLFDITKGNLDSIEWIIEPSNLFLFDLAYDAQSFDFAEGDTITGVSSRTTGKIVKDTDSGTSGTLVVSINNNKEVGFIDNENITSSSGGLAVVNGAVNSVTSEPSDFSFYKDTVSVLEKGTETVYLNKIVKDLTELDTRDRFTYKFDINFQLLRLSVKGVGDPTGSLLSIDAILGEV